MISGTDLNNLAGLTVYGLNEEKIGKVADVYQSTEGSDGTFVTVSTGLFGSSASFIPLSDARVEGDKLVVPYDKELVKDAPRVEDDEELTAPEEDRLHQHYSNASTQSAPPPPPAAGSGHDTSGPNTDDAMTRSEERLQVGTQQVESGRARLRKYVTTSTETVQVPVKKETLSVEREPMTDANAGQAMDGPAISEEEHEVVLTEERPVVAKEAVPVERVRVGKQVETEQATVSEGVRQEQIDLDEGSAPPR
ncbi:MAG: PRC and DUF2382 domain-containing protein [Actinomycetota bacterium]|nr:PRC and DUF2382 domain-containing protein [Actinomycetota bacterium]